MGEGVCRICSWLEVRVPAGTINQLPYGFFAEASILFKLLCGSLPLFLIQLLLGLPLSTLAQALDEQLFLLFQFLNEDRENFLDYGIG